MIDLPIYSSGTDSGRSYTVAPSKIIALGLNYRDHIAESEKVNVQGFTKDIPMEPILFPKTPNTLIGPEQPIVIPAIARSYGFEDFRVDYEAELAFFIGDRCKDVEPGQAWQHISGFTCFNDVSQRNIQSSDRAGWFRGKSFDTFGPIGPCVVSHKDIGDPQNLTIECRLNGSVVQSSNTRYMIFSIPEILSFVSRNFTLEAGDIICTGTPSGVGAIRAGDVVEVDIEGIGILRNPVREE
ncbi:MAG: fumarylacetoacetate hydrolase family protein [Spirochaetaceae bacterium]|nr:MAG: fumarylacetoacetate hydrolase family protein [Spirochaetaceae bacterium]